jgi:hypothetical protein
VRFTIKAVRELAALAAGLDEEDACEVLANLTTSDFARRLRSRKTGEWMYVFKPEVGEVVIYLKVVLRGDCVVISFHEEGNQSDDEDS